MPWRVTLLLVSVLLLLALGLRLWRIEQTPPGFHFDESFEGVEAWRILQEPAYRPIFLTGNFGVLPLNAYANALIFGLFGLAGGEAGPTAMRTTAAIFGVLGVLAVYALADELRRHDDPARRSLFFPFFAAATLAVMRWHIHFSRMGIEPILTPLLWAASTWLLLRGWRTGSWLSFAGSGALLAAAMYAYQGAWIMPLLAVVVVIVLFWSAAEWKQAKSPRATFRSPALSGLLIAAGVATLLVAPLAFYFWQHPEQFLLRPAQIAVGGASEGQGTALQMAWATAKMFAPVSGFGDPDPRRNLPGAPALNLWLLLPFYIGLVLALVRSQRPTYSLPLIGLAGLVLPGVFSEYAPHYHRILGAAAPTALLCGLGLDWLWQQGQRVERAQLALRMGVIGLLAAGAVVSARDYFVRWAALPDLFYAFDVGLWQIGQQIAALPPQTPLYLTPRDASHPTLAFALATRPGNVPQPISFDGRWIFPLTAQITTDAERYLVITHEDFRTPLLLPEIFPTAQTTQEWLDWQNQPYARLYERPPQAEPQRPPQQELVAQLGDGIALAGYDVQPATLQAGQILYLQLHWLVDTPPTTNWTVFTHLVAHQDNGTQQVVAGKDSQPGNGTLPTVRWQPGWRILDEYQLALPADLPAGLYQLQIGLYEAGGRRLPAGVAGLTLGEVTIE